MGEEVFFLAVVWLAGWDAFVEGRNAQDGKTSVSICWLWIARDAECGGLRSMDSGGESLVVGGGLNCRNFAWCRLQITGHSIVCFWKGEREIGNEEFFVHFVLPLKMAGVKSLSASLSFPSKCKQFLSCQNVRRQVFWPQAAARRVHWFWRRKGILPCFLSLGKDCRDLSRLFHRVRASFLCVIVGGIAPCRAGWQNLAFPRF